MEITITDIVDKEGNKVGKQVRICDQVDTTKVDMNPKDPEKLKPYLENLKKADEETMARIREKTPNVTLFPTPEKKLIARAVLARTAVCEQNVQDLYDELCPPWIKNGPLRDCEDEPRDFQYSKNYNTGHVSYAKAYDLKAG